MPTDVNPSNRDQTVLSLIRRPYVAEILTALDEHPRTLADLRRATGASRGLVVAALHALAAHHAIARISIAGSWDTTERAGLRHHLTPAGSELMEYLFDLDVWRAAYGS